MPDGRDDVLQRALVRVHRLAARRADRLGLERRRSIRTTSPATLERWSDVARPRRAVRGRVPACGARDGAYRWHLARAVPMRDDERRDRRLGRHRHRHRGPPARRGAAAVPRRGRLGARQLARLRADARRRRPARGAADRRLVRGRHLRRRTAGAARARARRSAEARARAASSSEPMLAASEAAGATAIRSQRAGARARDRRGGARDASASTSASSRSRARSRRARTSRVPLVARGEVFGSISLVTAESGRIYGEDDLDARPGARAARRGGDRQRPALRRGRAPRARGAGARSGRRRRRPRRPRRRRSGSGTRPPRTITGAGRAGRARAARSRRSFTGWAADRAADPGREQPGEPVRAETVPVEFGGRELWLSGSGVGFDEGTVYAFRDLTEERALEEMKAEFVATVSHELRTPLAAIYGSAQTIRRDGHRARRPEITRPAARRDRDGVRPARRRSSTTCCSRASSTPTGCRVTIERCDPVELAGAVVESGADAPAGGDRARAASAPKRVHERRRRPRAAPPGARRTSSTTRSSTRRRAASSRSRSRTATARSASRSSTRDSASRLPSTGGSSRSSTVSIRT